MLSLLFSSSGVRAAADVVVIMNQKTPVTSLTSTELEDYFMKRKRLWPNGETVRFFDFRDENESRQLFLKKFIQKNSREIELFWIGEKIYTGNIAPIQLASDSMMIRMVSRFPGGIGYVSSTTKIPANLRALTIKEVPRSKTPETAGKAN